ncbi:Cof-type HAD-IIB family hydrolase [Proteiniphilum sp. UBA5510]|jgi:hypothetical protein|uniref:Cof-type HAD-IIB family hydrolase n=1 Tax=Proteiniphilum sp. UBA5510 TaxID=1947286 RepID=UPI00257F1052|nr:Cof-type HAD-IIB family hydrolase [Proteiniphilum sp. UBA5510]MDD4630921.1 Cof-type HAD-IIB family hydrolase [Proteiniphilum sp.]
MKEKDYKLIALDMDGTLLTSNKSILPETIEDINAAVKVGKDVVFSTGRGLVEMKSFFEQIPQINYAIVFSGAVVYNITEKEIIYCDSIPQQVALEIIKIADAFQAMAHLLTLNESIVDKRQVQQMAEYNMKIYQSSFLKITTQVDSLAEACINYPSFPKVNIYFRRREDRMAAYEQLKLYPITFAFAEEASLEMSPLNTTKGTALLHLASHLGIDVSETIAVGDADNDRDILLKAGLAVAMENANKDIKEMADEIVTDNDHNGTGEAIKKFLLQLQ